MASAVRWSVTIGQISCADTKPECSSSAASVGLSVGGAA